ncbi:transposase [Altererythrobacter lutimaris]|uniref:Transposase n=1 Tax=Altererythrobacter lutimaris TaxID=2743979 RepID=A0A850HC90_9SPHN|nr:transposase [Altererythrobacter lutimaris]NVE94536.1 transposase [Altererythrobacter lutimaris]
MPQVLEIKDSASCALGDCVEGIAASGFDPGDASSTQEAAHWLRKLGNNREFLSDLLLRQLESQYREDVIESGYGPQAILLSPLNNGTFLRANIWPSATDHCYQASGAKTFVYGVPHDHNFSFLTVGYLGPGYQSDYFEYAYEDVAGYAGEQCELTFIERSALNEGKLMLYRAHKDIHSQIPPESLSVSINVMKVDTAQSWYDQYGFDLDSGRVEKVLSPNATEVFLRVAVATGHEDALDLAEQFGRHHPSDRLKLASFEARSLLSQDDAARDGLWREAELSGSRMLEAIAKTRRAELEQA